MDQPPQQGKAWSNHQCLETRGDSRSGVVRGKSHPLKAQEPVGFSLKKQFVGKGNKHIVQHVTPGKHMYRHVYHITVSRLLSEWRHTRPNARPPSHVVCYTWRGQWAISFRSKLEFDLCDGFGGVETLRARFRAYDFERLASALAPRIQCVKLVWYGGT